MSKYIYIKTLFLLILFFFNVKYLSAKKRIIISYNNPDEILCTPSKMLCPGGSVQLTLSTDQSNAQIVWFLNGVTIQAANQPTYTATSVGSYSATATFGGNTVVFPKVDILKSDTPVASFTHSADGKCATSPIRFTSTSTGTNLKYTWDFGDPNSQKSNTSNLENPSHLFIGNHGNGTQVYTVKLTVTNEAGCATSVAKTTIKLNQTPSTSLSANGLTFYNGASYFVSCTTTPSSFKFINKSGTSNLSYRIAWGDKSTDFISKTFQSVTHTYLPGFYTMFFSVTGLKGCVNTQTYYVYVGISPQISVEKQADKVCVHQPMVINIKNLTPAATSYKVTYDDGVVKNYSKSVDTIMHTFENSSQNQTAVTSQGTFNNAYTVVIEASNPCGKVSIDTGPIFVIDLPQKPVVTSHINICLNTGAAPLTATPANGNNLTWYTDATLKNKYSQAPSPPTNIAQAITYYVSQTNPTGCESDVAEIIVNILPLIENNTIGTDQILCFGDTPSKILATEALKGGNGQFEYQWQVSTDNSRTWSSNITNNTSSDYFPNGLPGNQRYRRLVSSGSCTSISNEVTIDIEPEIVNYNLLGKDQFILPGDSPALIKGGYPSGGSNEYKFTWDESTDNLNWKPIPNTTEVDFQPPKSAVNMYYRRITTSGRCMVVSAPVKVFVKSSIFIPTAFTPNGDGVNDKWTIKGFEYDSKFRVKVYNRYGEMIVNSKSSTWDGLYNGKQLQSGVYYYILTADKVNLSGYVTIIL
jgi:gliding motility-associated-like protein